MFETLDSCFKFCKIPNQSRKLNKRKISINFLYQQKYPQLFAAAGITEQVNDVIVVFIDDVVMTSFCVFGYEISDGYSYYLGAIFLKGVTPDFFNFLRFWWNFGSRLIRLRWFQKSKRFDSRAPHSRVTNFGSKYGKNGKTVKIRFFLLIRKSITLFKLKYGNFRNTVFFG